MNNTNNTGQPTAIYIYALIAGIIGFWQSESIGTGLIFAAVCAAAIWIAQEERYTLILVKVQSFLKTLYWWVTSKASGHNDIGLDKYEWCSGKDIETGEFIITSLEEAGSFGVYAITRTGKSSFLHSFIYQLITNNAPNELGLVIADLKNGLDFRFFRHLKHLALPISETTSEAEKQINWLLQEKERRAELFKCVPKFEPCSSLQDYHQLNISLGLPTLPYIVAIFDEFQNVTLEKESALNGLVKIAKEGQGFGIYTICSTQLPNVEALPTRLKSQFTSWFCGYLANPSHYYKIVEVGKEIWEPFHNGGKIKGRFIASISGQLTTIQSIYINKSDLKKTAQYYSNEFEPAWPDIKAMDNLVFEWRGNDETKRAMLTRWLIDLDHEPTPDEAIETFGFSQATFYNWDVIGMWKNIHSN